MTKRTRIERNRVIATGQRPDGLTSRESRRRAARAMRKTRPVLVAGHLVRRADDYCETCDRPAGPECLPS